MSDDLAALEELAVKCERETQVWLGHKNDERAAMLRRVASRLRLHLQPDAVPSVAALGGIVERMRALATDPDNQSGFVFRDVLAMFAMEIERASRLTGAP